MKKKTEFAIAGLITVGLTIIGGVCGNYTLMTFSLLLPIFIILEDIESERNERENHKS